jgi:hydrogenase nickel incorporation protein HypB
MCGICGCVGDGAVIDAKGTAHGHTHVHADGPVVRHGHNAPDPARGRVIAVERDLLEANAAQARANRAHFAAHRLLVLNIVSSPGSGKTTLLVETVKRLADTPVAVIEGDQQTSLDADRIRAAGAAAVQVNTGKGCHLEASQIDRAFHHLHDLEDGVLFIENVGNLVCPASFDLGETHRVVIASVTEGEDKPLKYPDIFASADLLLVSKADLAEPCGADVDLLIANARKVRPGLAAIVVSARSGVGIARWLNWIAAARAMTQACA